VDISSQATAIKVNLNDQSGLVVGAEASTPGASYLRLDTTSGDEKIIIGQKSDVNKLIIQTSNIDLTNQDTSVQLKASRQDALQILDQGKQLLVVDTSHSGDRLDVNVAEIDLETQNVLLQTIDNQAEALTIGRYGANENNVVLDTSGTGRLALHLSHLDVSNRAATLKVKNGDSAAFVVSDGSDNLLSLDTSGNLAATKLVSKIATLDTSNQDTDLVVKSGASSALSISETGANVLLAVDTSTTGERLEVNMKYLDVTNQATEITVKQDSAALTVKATGDSDSILAIDSAATGNKLTLRTANIDVADQATTLTILNGASAALVVSDGTDDLVTISTSGNLAATKLVSKVATLDTSAQATKLHVKSADAVAFAIADDDNVAGLFVVDTNAAGERVDMNVDLIEVGDDDAFTLKKPTAADGSHGTDFLIQGQNGGGGGLDKNGGNVVIQAGQNATAGATAGVILFKDGSDGSTSVTLNTAGTASTTATTGTMVVTGGLGVSAQVTSDTAKFTADTDSTSRTSGTLQVVGGLGVTKRISSNKLLVDGGEVHFATVATAVEIKTGESAALSIKDADNAGGLFVVDTATSGERIDMNVDTIEVGDDDAFTLTRPAHSTGAAASFSVVGQALVVPPRLTEEMWRSAPGQKLALEVMGKSSFKTRTARPLSR
jgi:hypothetical protein